MEELIVEREWSSAYVQTTILKDTKGKVVAIFNKANQQPKKNTPTIDITKLGKTKTYKLCWDNIK